MLINERNTNNDGFINEFLIDEKIFLLPSEFKEYFLSDGVNSTKAIEILIKYDLKSKIEDCIKDFKVVFPKINNISAKDASFAIYDMKCHSIDEIFILLKYSGKIRDYVIKNNHDNELILTLKKWVNVDKTKEFRILFLSSVLIGVSQRYLNIVNSISKEISNNDCKDKNDDSLVQKMFKLNVINFLLDLTNKSNLININENFCIDIFYDNNETKSNEENRIKIIKFKEISKDILDRLECNENQYENKKVFINTLLLFEKNDIIEKLKDYDYCQLMCIKNLEKDNKLNSNDGNLSLYTKMLQLKLVYSQEIADDYNYLYNINDSPVELEEYGCNMIEELMKQVELQKINKDNKS